MCTTGFSFHSIIALLVSLAWSVASALPTSSRGAAMTRLGSSVKIATMLGAAIGNSATKRDTNEVVSVKNGIRQLTLGGSGIIVSEVGLGTQRWVSDDANAPDEAEVFKMMDEAILNSGINLLDTAEQYPIPSSQSKPEGTVETTIGKWLRKGKGRREKVVIASKITGGRNVNKENIRNDCIGSLQRLGTDYLDMYLLHWPARYSPQANWGQSLEYNHAAEPYYKNNADFTEIVAAMGQLVNEGLIRGYGFANDNCFGLSSAYYTAQALKVPPPIVMQNDYSLINRRIEENALSEAMSAANLNCGFLAYNVLAGGLLTGKYRGRPTTYDNPNFAASMLTRANPRGRHDDTSWGRTLYRYRSGPALQAVDSYAEIAAKNGMTLLELALLFGRGRRAVTSQLLGTSNIDQLKQNLQILRKPSVGTPDGSLPYEVQWQVDRVHMRNRNPIFASDRAGTDWYNEGEIGERIP